MINVDINNQLVSRVAETLIFLSENPKSSIRNISRVLNIDYNYVAKIVEKCEGQNILKTEMVARERQVVLTKKGMNIADNLKAVKKLL